jgi:hypothetical protein
MISSFYRNWGEKNRLFLERRVGTGSLASSVKDESNGENDNEEDDDAGNDDKNFSGDREASSALVGIEDSFGGFRITHLSDIGQTIIDVFGTIQFSGPFEVHGAELSSFRWDGEILAASKCNVVGFNGNGIVFGNSDILNDDVIDSDNTHVFIVAHVIGGESGSAFAVIGKGFGGEDSFDLVVESGGICGTILNGVEGIGQGVRGVKMKVVGFIEEGKIGGRLPNSFGLSCFDEITGCFPVVIGICKRVHEGEEEDNKGEGGLEGHSL